MFILAKQHMGDKVNNTSVLNLRDKIIMRLSNIGYICSACDSQSQMWPTSDSWFNNHVYWPPRTMIDNLWLHSTHLEEATDVTLWIWPKIKRACLLYIVPVKQVILLLKKKPAKILLCVNYLQYTGAKSSFIFRKSTKK